ncbi:MAG: hypothetical protein HY784_17335 [Chloroflexi bacterium]|nr:hypothetical protein [Chloroflexota bacterium]
MKMTIDRKLCDHVLPACEQCFGRLMRNPLGEDRHCITEFVDDGNPDLSLRMIYDDSEEQLFLTPEDREQIANWGWSLFVRVPPRMYRGG